MQQEAPGILVLCRAGGISNEHDLELTQLLTRLHLFMLHFGVTYILLLAMFEVIFKGVISNKAREVF